MHEVDSRSRSRNGSQPAEIAGVACATPGLTDRRHASDTDFLLIRADWGKRADKLLCYHGAVQLMSRAPYMLHKMSYTDCDKSCIHKFLSN